MHVYSQYSHINEETNHEAKGQKIHFPFALLFLQGLLVKRPESPPLHQLTHGNLQDHVSLCRRRGKRGREGLDGAEDG